jgi:hypothetical protein
MLGKGLKVSGIKQDLIDHLRKAMRIGIVNKNNKENPSNVSRRRRMMMKEMG